MIHLPFSFLAWNFYWCYGIGASFLGVIGIYRGQKIRSVSRQAQLRAEREKKRADKLANFVIPIGLALGAETDLNTLLEKILLEAKILSLADGGTLYLVTPENTLRFVMVLNDTLKIAMGGTSGKEVTLPPLDLYDPASGQPNLHNIATSCALDAKSIAIADVYAAEGYDFSGTKAFDERMNYRTISVLCVPLRNSDRTVIGVLQLINARSPDARAVIPFDEHLCQMMELLGLLAAASLASYLKTKKLTDQIAELKIQIDEAKKERQVAEITDSDYFKSLQSRAREMRAKVKGQTT
jgi:GAF domain-containing protein